jgi:hypothetical protein
MLARILVVLTLLATTARADDPDTRTVRGTIVATVAAKGEEKTRGPGSIEVDLDRGPMIFWLTSKTKLEKLIGEKSEPCTFAELKKGDRIEVEYDPVIAPSFPPQAGAYRIVLLERAK